MKTSELTGKTLNWAVGKAEGLDGWLAPVNYCGKWEHGGPIIEREKIQIKENGHGHWFAKKFIQDGWVRGATPLIAAMRCFVTSKLGEDVSIPEELA